MMVKSIKRKSFLILMLVFAIVLVKQTYAVGIYFPNDNEIDFKPGIEKTFKFAISSSKMDVGLSVSGYLSEYVSLSKDIIKSDSTDRTFKVFVNLPEEIEKPGHHKVWIKAREIIEDSEIQGNIGTSCDARVYLMVNVLNPGKYVDMSLSASNANLNEPVNFVVNVKNFGEEDIKKVKAAINVYSPNNKKIATVYTDEKPLMSNTKDSLRAKFNTQGYEAGTYSAVAILDYDGEKKEDKKNFKIGELNIKIINYTKEFEKDKINKFDIEIESDWGNKIENIYGEIKINEEIIKTPNIELSPWEKQTITAYWDTSNFEAREYDAEIRVYYEDKIAEEDIVIEVIEKKLPLIESPGIISLATTTLLTLVALLLIIVMIILTKKRNEKDKKKKKRSKGSK